MREFFKRRGFVILFAGFISVSGTSSSAVAQDFTFNDRFQSCMNNMKKDCQQWALKGGETPRGLSGDTRVELAPGEKYVLTGIVNIIANEPYLEINLRKHPYLASASRRHEPFYRIEADAAQWKKYGGREIALVATARYTAWESRTGKLRIEVYLDPADDPVPPALQRR